MILTINPTFQNLIPTLTAHEYAALEASILSEGCRDSIIHWQGVIVDGHNRYAICEQHGIAYSTLERHFEDEVDARIWIRKNAAARRNLTPVQRDILALDLKTDLEIKAKENMSEGGAVGGSKTKLDDNKGLQTFVNPIDSTREAAAEFNTSHESMRKTKTVLEHGDEQTKAALLSGEISRNEAYKKIKKKQKKDQQKQQRKTEIVAVNPMILTGDMRVLGNDIEDNSIDLIFTDPPYGKDHIVDYEALAQLGNRVLKDGASLLCYCGQSVLPEVLVAMTRYLRYHWTIAIYYHTGSNQRMPGKFVFIEWKPILWFTKGHRRDDHYISDTFSSMQAEKKYHDWQQELATASHYIQYLTLENEIVLDPFCGSGTSCLAAKQLGRQYLGFEIDETTANNARKRIANV